MPLVKEYRDRDGRFHREDGPAIIYPHGTQIWCFHGEYHREDGPAIIGSDGREFWYVHGKPHREDGPAVIYSNGTQEWWFHGKKLNDMQVFIAKSRILSKEGSF